MRTERREIMIKTESKIALKKVMRELFFGFTRALSGLTGRDWWIGGLMD